MDKQEGQIQIARLVEKYDRLTQAERRNYNESMTCRDFITPLFQALGWDIHNIYNDL